MADCITELITSNLVSAIDGKVIVIAGVNRTLTCERERFVNLANDRYPLVLLSGPIVQVDTRAHRTMNCNIHYQLLMSDNSVVDDYSPVATVDPITKTYGNAAADLIKLVMVSPNRGGNAQHTEILGWS